MPAFPRLSRAARRGARSGRDLVARRRPAPADGAPRDDGYEADKARHLDRIAAAGSPPIVIYAMGKSGTTAIDESLKAAGFAPVLKVHSLRPQRLEVMEAQYRRTDPSARPHHVWEAQHLLAHPATPEAPWTVITSVRDPLGQAVAKFFQSGERLGHIDRSSTVASLEAAFADQWKLPLDWFEVQMQTCLGLDVYAHPFDPTVGWGTIETPSLRCLLLRMEGMAKAPEALAAHLGVDQPVPIVRANAAADKGYSSLYKAFRDQVRPPAEVIERAYSSRLVQHFYTPEEIEGFRRAWSR